MDFLNDNRKILIRMLSAAIRGKTLHSIFCTGIDWQNVYDEAVKHQVMPLLYPILVKYGESMGIPEALLANWQKSGLYEGIIQDQNYMKIGKVLERFTNAGIPVIVLKGLILRELYPHSCLRTMGDADFLVHPCDMHRAGLLLEADGYFLHTDDIKHASFFNEVFSEIELHRILFWDKRFEKSKVLELQAWNNAVPINISGTEVLSLCPQDNILYLCHHMASHIISNGFGLRQLCDLVLFIENYCNEINWVDFFRLAALYHIDTFINVLLKVCHVLLGLQLPEICQKYEPQDVLLVSSFIEDIFDGGVFGMNSTERITANRLLYYSDGNNAKGFRQKVHGFINLLLPNTSKLDIRFSYARKHHFLLPAAWIHRIFYILFQKDINFEEKTAVLTSSVPAAICRNRSALLSRLGLLD